MKWIVISPGSAKAEVCRQRPPISILSRTLVCFRKSFGKSCQFLANKCHQFSNLEVTWSQTRSILGSSLTLEPSTKLTKKDNNEFHKHNNNNNNNNDDNNNNYHNNNQIASNNHISSEKKCLGASAPEPTVLAATTDLHEWATVLPSANLLPQIPGKGTQPSIL